MKAKVLEVEVYDKVPDKFCPQVHAAGCYLEIDGKLLLLQRAGHKSEPGRWGVPAGKLEKNETPEEAARRELFEETGIDLETRPSKLQYIGPLYIRKLGFDYIYHSFQVHLDEAVAPEIQLSDEHENYLWVTDQEAKSLPLMAGALEGLRYYRALPPKKRTGASVSAYLILQQGNQILLGLRKNTGYNDGRWSLVAGHVEDGEGATSAMIREAKEEIGIDISAADLKIVHIMHRNSNRYNVDIFFTCSTWKGEIQNCELEKCEQWSFFPQDALPANMVDYNKYVLEARTKGEFYSEHGWS